MAGSVSNTPTPLHGANLLKLVFAWVADGSGDVSVAYDVRPGELRQIKFIPDSGGTQPDNLYDVTLLDSDNVDFLAGAGANLSNSAASITKPTSPLIHDGTSQLTLTVANAGASNGGTVVLYIAPVVGR